MAATPLTVAAISRTGLVQTLVAADGTNGNSIANPLGNAFLHIKNASGGSITVTAAITGAVDGVTPAGKSLAVAAGAEADFGPFPPASYNDALGNVNFSFSSATSVTVQAKTLVAGV